MFDLSGRVALVTGASRGIGRATAVALASQGAWVAVNYATNAAAAEETLAAMRAAGGDGELLPFDVSDASEVIAYCGSGVSACLDLLALEHAGLGRGRLFVGSWSQYSATDRPVATGAEPGFATTT